MARMRRRQRACPPSPSAAENCRTRARRRPRCRPCSPAPTTTAGRSVAAGRGTAGRAWAGIIPSLIQIRTVRIGAIRRFVQTWSCAQSLNFPPPVQNFGRRHLTCCGSSPSLPPQALSPGAERGCEGASAAAGLRRCWMCCCCYCC